MSSSLSPLHKIYAAIQAHRSVADVIGDVVALMRRLASEDTDPITQLMRPQQHPLGFFVCKWSLGRGQTLRLHLWSKEFRWAQEPGWEIHDHVFSFSSLVLLGALRNRTFEISTSSSDAPRYAVYEVSYTDMGSSMALSRPDVSLQINTNTIEEAGTTYRMNAGVLHSSELISDLALTILAARDQTADFQTARVISAHHMESVTFDRSPSGNLDVSDLLSKFADTLEG